MFFVFVLKEGMYPLYLDENYFKTLSRVSQFKEGQLFVKYILETFTLDFLRKLRGKVITSNKY